MRPILLGAALASTVASSALAQPTQLTFGGSEGEAAWSPFGLTIAYFDPSDGGIWILPLGGTAVPFTDQPGSQFNPAWSPDGTMIAYYSNADADLYLKPVGPAGDGVPFVTSEGSDLHPTFSPDGTKIAFATNRNSNQYDIYVKPVAGGVETRLTFAFTEDEFPDFSPDGTTIVFSRDTELWTVPAHGGGAPQPILGGSAQPITSAIRPDYSPDGAVIVYESLVDNALYEVYSAGGEPVALTSPGTALDMTPDHSPDGSQILFTRRIGPAFFLYVLDVDPVALHRLSWGELKHLMQK